MLGFRQIIVVMKPFRAEAVLQAIASAPFDVSACTVREAKGYGRQKGYLDRYRGSEYSMAYLPKVEITAWVEVSNYDALVELITRVARTGRIGDGKVFGIPTAWPEAIEF